jgi:5-methylcytosine-specific restriction endonuclease McrA
VTEYARRYHRDNAELKSQKAKDYYRATAEARREYGRNYARNNYDARRSYLREWYKNNPDKAREIAQARRARELDAFVENVERKIVFQADNYTCQLCGITCPQDAVYPAKNFATLDHIVPLSRGGLHCYDNVQTLCFSCNCAKGARIS